MRLRFYIVATLALFGNAVARADGALADSSQLFLPLDRPQEIVVGTNFGLLISQDNGATVHWVCEQAIVGCATQYEQAPPPSDTLFALSPNGLVMVGADACQYGVAKGLSEVDDMFIDPSDGHRVLALTALANDAGDTPAVALVSSDGGQSFSTVLYTAPVGSALLGVEIAKSDPNTIYLTQQVRTTGAISILHSTDGGQSFQSYDQSATLGLGDLKIVAVDPLDPTRVYLRFTERAGGSDSFVVSTDGGMTVRVAQALPAGYVMSAFLLQSDGTLLLAGLQLNLDPLATPDCGGKKPYAKLAGVAYRSKDSGQTFTTWPNPPHLRALGERNGVLYAVGDNLLDGFAVGTSTNGGQSWKKLFQYADILGPLSCGEIPDTCADPWSKLDFKGSPPPPPKAGCDYSSARRPMGELAIFGLVTLTLLAARRRRRRRSIAK